VLKYRAGHGGTVATEDLAAAVVSRCRLQPNGGHDYWRDPAVN
jgi:hypothetical protein